MGDGASTGSALHLTAVEQSLFYLLAANSVRLLTRDEILDTLWGADYVVESNVMADSRVRNLRGTLQTHIDSRARWNHQRHAGPGSVWTVRRATVRSSAAQHRASSRNFMTPPPAPATLAGAGVVQGEQAPAGDGHPTGRHGQRHPSSSERGFRPARRPSTARWTSGVRPARGATGWQHYHRRPWFSTSCRDLECGPPALIDELFAPDYRGSGLPRNLPSTRTSRERLQRVS